MSYPPEYIPKFDLRKAQDDGDKLSATELNIELESVATALNQTILFMRSITTANMKLQPTQISGTTFVIPDEQTAIAAQTDIFFANGVTINPTISTVGVFIDGVRLADSAVTLFTDHVAVTPALGAGNNIVMEIHDNAASILNDLISNLNALGASLVGIEDIAGVFAASNVEDALAEVRLLVDAFITAVGDLTKYLRADVTVPWEIDQDAAGYTIKNLAPAIDPEDPVILSQITAVLAILSDLSNSFLPLTGGVMQGPINMAGKRLTSLTTPVAASDAARKQDVDDVATDLDKFIPAAGAASVDFAAQANLTGALTFNQSPTALASSTQDAAALVPTLTGLAKPSQPGQVANKQFVDDLETNLQSQISTLSSSAVGYVPDGSPKEGASIGGCVLDGSGFGAVPDINSGGIYNFTTLTVVGAQTPAEDTFIFASGDIAINNNITMAELNLDISTDGNIDIDSAATITCGQLLLRAGGTITIDGVIVANGGAFRARVANSIPTLIGIGGFVSINAGGACDIGATCTITTLVCGISAGADSIMAGTIRAKMVDEAGGIGGQTSSYTAGSGSQFGRDIGFLSAGGTVGAQGATPDQIETLQYVPYRYSGTGGASAANSGTARGGGGGAGGTAGNFGGVGATTGGAGGTAFVNGTYRPYLYPMHPGGGGGGGINTPATAGGAPGGAVFIYVIGALVATGFSINAKGNNGVAGGGGGGGGGAIRVVCTGLLTDGTADSDGGNGGVTGGGGGGAGSAHFIASSVTGTQNPTAAGGANGGGGAGGGGNGTAATVVMPNADILCFASDGYWSR